MVKRAVVTWLKDRALAYWCPVSGLSSFIMLWIADNGGDVYESGNNYPLRGWKHSLWEGGIHGIGFVHSPWLKKPGRASMDLMHISDWYPTLLHLAGSNASTEHLDGYNQWDTIRYSPVNVPKKGAITSPVSEHCGMLMINRAQSRTWLGNAMSGGRWNLPPAELRPLR